jgi:GNAT superfamily N-acetyltransferase/nitroimidazol reductase NimA-like FMN-containing flavoprotein (pyridoxamine 5'-phosphate oxidase superfamily)
MRRAEFAMSPAEARALLAELPVVHLASTLPDGSPVLRTVNSVVVDDWVAFHAAPKGEKTGFLGRAAVLQAEEDLGMVPSTFFDTEKACPATTYYRSVQVHGVVEEITDRPQKARVLQALMEKLQPEGGHIPITADHPHYKGPVNGLLVAGVRLERITGKAKLAQNRTPAQIADLLDKLWRRGADGDPRALELIRAANPDAPPPAFLAAPEGATLHAWLPPAAADAAARLLDGSYWNDVFEHADLVAAHRGSDAWVGARDAAGRLIASARALADGGKLAWIYDVIVAPAWRGRGLGQAVVRLLLDHPRVRGCKRVMLGTRDAQPLYARLGFVDKAALPPRAFTSSDMILVREGTGSGVSSGRISS